MSVTSQERELLRRCLNQEPGAWDEFVERFLGLVYHVIQYTAHLRSVKLQPEDVEDIAAEVLLALIANDFAALRHFRGKSSFATYLTVIARRTCVQELVRRATARDNQANRDGRSEESAINDRGQGGLERLEEVARLLKKLPRREREVVRMYHLEGRSYEEISTKLHIPINSIGPILTRAREKLRKG